MGLNYRLLDKEKKEEERRARVGGREQKSNAVKEAAGAGNTEEAV